MTPHSSAIDIRCQWALGSASVRVARVVICILALSGCTVATPHVPERVQPSLELTDELGPFDINQIVVSDPALAGSHATLYLPSSSGHAGANK